MLSFDDPAVHQLRQDLALALRAAAHHGLAEGVCNHFSVELPDGSGRFLLNPRGLLWQEVTADDVVLVDAMGQALAGRHPVEPTAMFIHGAIHRLSGRARDNRLVHFAVNAGAGDDGAVAAGRNADVPRPGDMASVQVTYGAPHHLVADGPFCVTRRTAAGDAWERRQSEVGCGPVGGAGASSDVGPIVLGLPTVGATPVL